MITTKHYTLNKMDTTAVDQLWKEIKPVYDHHFNHVFNQDYLSAKCKDAFVARLRVIWQDAEAVGVMMLFGYKVKVNNKTMTLYRASAAVDQAHRSKSNLSSFMFSSVIPIALRQGFRNQYFTEGFIHPSAFSLAQKNIAQIYPSPDQATPQTIVDLMKVIPKDSNVLNGLEFKYDNPFLAYCPLNTFQTHQEVISWQQKIQTDAHIEYFHQQGGLQNHRAFICIAPVTIKNMVLSLLKSRRNRAKYMAQKKKQSRELAHA